MNTKSSQILNENKIHKKGLLKVDVNHKQKRIKTTQEFV